MSEVAINVALVFPLTGDPAAQTKPHPLSVVAPYTQSSKGVVAVANGTVTSTAKSIPFGSIATEATAFVLRNRTSQELEVTLNGVDTMWTIAKGAVLAFAQPSSGDGVPITAITLTTTATQSGTGEIDYWVFGD
jgi:hypothetical protein